LVAFASSEKVGHVLATWVCLAGSGESSTVSTPTAGVWM
jgi:hypothetical protein